MKIYKINGSTQNSCVVAETIVEAISLYEGVYGYGKVEKIELWSSYVVTEEDLKKATNKESKEKHWEVER